MQMSEVRKFLAAQAPVILFLIATFAGGDTSWLYAAAVAELGALGVYVATNTPAAPVA